MEQGEGQTMERPPADAQHGQTRRRFILRVTLAYAAVASLWIVLSDQMLAGLGRLGTAIPPGTVKGMAFVAVTTVLLAWALRTVPGAGTRGQRRTGETKERGREPGRKPGRDLAGRRRLLAALALAGVLTVTAGVLAFQAQSATEREEQQSRLEEVARLQTAALSHWLQEHRAMARMIGTDPGRLADAQRILQADPECLRLEMRDSAGRLIAAAALPGIGGDLVAGPELQEAVTAAWRTRQTAYFDLQPPDGPAFLGIAEPLPAAEKDQAPGGVLVLYLDPRNFLYPYLSTWPLPGSTGETLLARPAGQDWRILNPPRLDRPAARQPLRLPGLRRLQPSAAGPFPVEGMDDRGSDVLGMAQTVPGTPWILVAKTDAAEALAPIRQIAGLITVLTGGALLLGAAGLGALWQRRQLAAARRDAALGQALRESEAKFRAYVEGCPVALLVIDAEGRYVDCNPAAVTLLGYDMATLTTLRVPMLHPVEDRGEVILDLAALSRDRTILRTYRLLRRDNSIVWVQSHIVALDDGRIMAFCQDISEQRQAAAALRASETRFSTIFRVSPIGLGLGEIDGKLLEVNQAWLDLVGFEREEVIGRSTAELGIYECPQDRDRIIETLRGQRRVCNLEIPYRRKNGERIIVQYSAEIIDLSGEFLLLVVVSDITRHKAEALALQRYAEIVEQLADPVIFLDPEERLQSVNRAFATLHQRPAGDLVGRRLREIIGEEPYRQAASRLKGALAGQPQRQSAERLFPDGLRHAFDIQLVPFQASGAVQGVIANMHDITDLRRIQNHLEAAQTMAGMGSWIKDLATGLYTSTHVVHTHPDWGDSFTEEMVEEIVHPDDRARRRRAWAEALAGGAPYDIEYRTRVNGRQHWVHVKAELEHDGEGRPVRAVGMVRDVTAMREAQQALEAYQAHLEDLVAARTAELEVAEAKMRLILDSSGDGLFGVAPEGGITFINRTACELLGSPPERLLGAPCERLYASLPDASACPIRETLRSGCGTRHHDALFIRASGQTLPVAYATHPMTQDGRIVGAVVSFIDISERKRTEEARENALAEAERLARIRREFLANMSHEIRTPLTAILGLAQLGLHESGPHEGSGGRTGRILGQILEAGQTLREVVDDILDFSKIEAARLKLERRPVLLGEVIDRAVGPVAARAYAKGLEMEVEEAADLPAACLGDSLRLEQILGNLLSNAVKFTPCPGRIGLAVRREGDRLVFAVTDSGIGMSGEQIGQMFHPFEQADGSTTRHFGGTGLGLSITRNLVALMGGSIGAVSQLDEGTTFTVRLPLTVAEPPAPPLCRPAAIALLGFPPAETDFLAGALQRRGLPVLPLGAEDPLAAAEAPSPADAMPPADAMMVAPAEMAGAAAGRAALESCLAGGRQVVLAVRPGDAPPPEELAGRLRLVERPLRIRHLLTPPPPAPPRQPAAAEAAQPAPGQRLKGLRVLMAEDNEVNRVVLDELLSLEGARTEEAENGRQALELLRQRGSAAYDIVITDIQMPQMDGYDLARHIAALDPALPVIGLTAHAMPEERERCLAAGMVEHVAKPVDIEHLAKVLLDHARRPPGAVPARREAPDAGQREFAGRLRDTVRRMHLETPRQLREAAAAGDFARLAMLARRIKGTADTLAAAELQDLARAAEATARLPQPRALDLAGELAETVERLLADLGEGPS